MSVTTPDTTPPTTPGTPNLSSATSTAATITWTASTDNVAVTGYSIYRNGTLAGTVSGGTKSFTDTGLTVKTTYSYTVVAFDAAMNSSPASGAERDHTGYHASDDAGNAEAVFSNLHGRDHHMDCLHR